MELKFWASWCLLTALCCMGCRSTPLADSSIATEVTTADTATPAAEPVVKTAIFFHDKPELQEGTGAMDSPTPPEFSETASGLNYRVLRASGGKKPTASDTVTVNYRGWLNNGKVFDSSYERGEPTTFPLGNVIAGWTEGMQLVGEGGMIELWVPSHLGYGERGSPGSIPPHAHLHFIVELINVD
ncbi:FKBP-type peptidyl-prolyl cis-trans isomerase [Rhodopirellula sp. JC740]|uniref:Peptidyl-prolyl cis-trans isomerase n=1 Tax=Rhodopirellula halodulae TaxID=2894198 RepID=A0ABS8NNU6_9BACT|nr:FKBP-type peptidyl-prolyl cis-trans isomerase [Rhodopirellula sp. JC737]MCC9645227.1 FKBP-type peptidyl-prolyl cis-trans isomerase [Rhodopirellula sp. JC740]MCC9655904.1 FKBP-type peptidyl-prolyl cis-trans isomerase [Rhodopirellula sp. JC737]